MLKWIADKVKKIDGEYQIPMSKVVDEIQNRISLSEVEVTYIFDDNSSVTINYTLDTEKMVKKTAGTIECKLKKTY